MSSSNIGAPSGPRPGYSPSVDRPETILIAEDDARVRALTRAILELEGYRVVEASDGPSALALADKFAFDLLITDLIMPGMNGKELAERIRAAHSGTGVLLISGFTDETVNPHGVIAPGDHYLAKPFSPDRLVLKVREVLRDQARRSIR